MDDCISREVAYNAIMGQPPDAHYPSWYGSIIQELPTADVRPVVCCKRCVHGFPVKSPDGTELVVCTNGFACDGIGHAPDFYCAEGEGK